MKELGCFERKVVLLFAYSNMNLSATSRALHYDRRTVQRLILKIGRKTGLDPYSFDGLVELVKIAKGEASGESAESDC